MNDNLPFDDFVKDQFSKYSPDVPERIWKNIAAKRNQKPKGFWMNMLKGNNLLMLSLLAVIAAGTCYFSFSPDKNILSNKNGAAPNAIATAQENVIPREQNINPGKQIISNDSSSEKQKSVSGNILNTPLINPDNKASNNNYFISPSYKKEIKNNKEEKLINDKDEIKYEPSQKTNLINTGLFTFFKINNARELSTKTLNSNNIKLPDCPSIEKDAAGNKKYWEVYAGPDKAFESFKTYSDTASTNYLQKRKASTKVSSAFSAGVRYTKVFENGVSVRAGLNYSQVNEKFLYFNPSELKFVTVITTRVIIRQPGDTVYINDTLQYQQSGTRTKTTYNRYRNIDVPLVIGYEIGNGKIHANINAGVIINVYSWYKGDVLDSLYQPVSITTGKGNSVYQFKNNIGVGFLGSVSVYYKITDRTHLVIEPYFRRNLSPMSKPNLNLQQKFNTAGLRAGVRFDLK